MRLRISFEVDFDEEEHAESGEDGDAEDYVCETIGNAMDDAGLMTSGITSEIIEEEA